LGFRACLAFGWLLGARRFTAGLALRGRRIFFGRALAAARRLADAALARAAGRRERLADRVFRDVDLGRATVFLAAIFEDSPPAG